MTATIDTPCPHGCPWPTWECCDRHDPPAAHAAPILVIGGIAALGYVLLGASLVLLGVLAWHALRGRS